MLPHKQELQRKLIEKPSFQQQMQGVQTKYRSLLQQAIYSDLSQISPKVIMEAGKDQDNHPLYFVFGEQQPTNKRGIDKLYLYLINFLDERVSDKYLQSNLRETQPFSIVYFNTCCESYNNYSTFRTIYRTLPLKYFQNLKRIIIVDPSFTVKAIEWFVSGTINKLMHNLTEYVYKLKQLKEYGIFLTKQKLSLFPSYLSEEKQKDIARLSIRESLQTRMSKKAPQKRKKTKQLKLEDYQANDLGVPIALYLMISYFLMRKDKLKEEGLFRKSVVKSEIDQAIEFIKQKYYDFLQQITNPHVVANLITRFIGDLQQPLIPTSVYQQLIHDNGKSTQIHYLKQCFSTMPQRNRVTLIYFFDFLLNEVIAQKEFNKMTCYNLAVVLAPCILKSGKQLAIQQLMYSKKLVLIVEHILNNYEDIFGNAEERKRFYRESVRAEKQKFMKQSLQGHGREESGASDCESDQNQDRVITKEELQEKLQCKVGDEEQKWGPKVEPHRPQQHHQSVQVYCFQDDQE